MEFAADFINGLLNRAVLEGGEARAAGADGGYLERVVFHGGGDVRDGPQDGIEQVHTRVALLLGGGRLHGPGDRWPTEGARGRHGRHTRLRLLVEHGASRREADAVDRDVGKLRLAQQFAELAVASRVHCFRDDEEHAPVSCVRAAREHLDACIHGVIQACAGEAQLDLRDGLLDLVAVGGKIEQLVDRIVEGQHCGFACRAQDRLREKNPGFVNFGQDGLNPRAVFDQNDHRDRVAAKVEVRDPLGHAIVIDAEVAAI